jgi:hypothetical protein
LRPVRRGDHVLTLEGGAHAGGGGLLADRDVQEAGQLARSEAILTFSSNRRISSISRKKPR